MIRQKRLLLNGAKLDFEENTAKVIYETVLLQSRNVVEKPTRILYLPTNHVYSLGGDCCFFRWKFFPNLPALKHPCLSAPVA